MLLLYYGSISVICISRVSDEYDEPMHGNTAGVWGFFFFKYSDYTVHTYELFIIPCFINSLVFGLSKSIQPCGIAHKLRPILVDDFLQSLSWKFLGM